jgi:hypothetical protein
LSNASLTISVADVKKKAIVTFELPLSRTKGITFLAMLQTFCAVRNDSKTMTHHPLQSHQNHKLPVPAIIQAAQVPMRADDFSEGCRANRVHIVERIS